MGFLIKPAAFGALILAGCLLRHKNILSSNDQKTFSRLVLNITLPAAVIHSFYGFEKEPSLYLMIAMGFLCSLLPFLAAYCLTGKLNRQDRMFTMVNIAGYNIGCFTLPLIQNFFGQTGSVAARGKYVSGDAKSPNASFCGAKSVFPICPVVPLINPQIISIAVNCSFAAMYDASCLMRLDFPVFPVFLIISRFLENRNASSDKKEPT